jgi:hypothetical protein
MSVALLVERMYVQQVSADMISDIHILRLDHNIVKVSDPSEYKLM